MSLLPERFLSKVEIDSEFGCWVWTAALSKDGYGQFKWEGQMRNPHRVAYQIVNAVTLDRSEHLDHFKFPEACRGPICCNPEHVRVTTPRENALRGNTVAARRLAATHCDQGHEFTEKNTIWRNGGKHKDRRYRECRTCHNEACYRSLARKKSAVDTDA